MRALVLGGNRYIGLHLVFELARQGHDVTVANSHEAPLPEGARRIHVDRQVPGALAEALEPVRDDFDIVYDNTSYRVADLEAVVAAFEGRVQQLVFTSSVAAYKRSWIQPVREDFARHAPDDPHPGKAYGVGKVNCEDHLAALHAEIGLPATILRVTHTIGPNTPLATREPVFFKRLEEGRPILIPADGFPFVHLVHVQDVARLMVSLADNRRCVGHAYNVAGAEFTSVLGCVRLMAEAAGVEPNIVHVPLDVARSQNPPLIHWGEGVLGGTVYSIDKALADLDWAPSYTLAEAYADSYAWFDKHGRDKFTYDFSRDDALLREHDLG
ncbi:MAG TPA: NAD-dependent epimerase/dehydratase family protein [Acidimicrobiales bacterium]|nr:NAD-dependent epimerase/dehydratase family protein [Acidimicrobiales bacterium]